ncbi:MAG: helix-turn-helix transcriptional regulator [Thermodesulfobacteriota bacterium]|nr:helix-turn-helix transcriptional regulator [Thermodesulfobacteriota bacterium]
MNSDEFTSARKKLRKTQKQMAELLGTSLKAVHSYEQGWRSVPAHVERQVIFLVSKRNGSKSRRPCWAVTQCPPEHKRLCPAWEFQDGSLCWFINGTICKGEVQSDWKEKMKICRECRVLSDLLPP